MRLAIGDDDMTGQSVRKIGFSRSALFKLSTFALACAAPACLAQTLTLSKVLEAATTQNPDLQALEAKLSMLEAKKSGATNIPAPMIGVSYMGSEGPFKSSGMDEKPSYEVSQTIPFPSKIFASQSAASSQLRAGQAAKQYGQKQVTTAVKAAFWNNYQAFYEYKYKVEQLQNLKDHLKRVSRSFVSDTLTNSHILSVQNEISMMDSEIDEAALNLSKARSALFIYTGLSLEELSKAPEELPISALPALASSTMPMAPSSPCPETPMLKKARAELEQSQAELTLARNGYLPDFNVKYKWNAETASQPRTQEIMLGMDLPFAFFWQPRAMVREAHAKVIEAEAMQTKATRESLSMQANLAEELAVKKRKIERLDSEILPRSEKRLRLAHAISFSDMNSLDQHREILEDYLKLKLEKLRLRAEFEMTIAELEVLQGEP